MWWFWSSADILTTDIWIQNELNGHLASNVSDLLASKVRLERSMTKLLPHHFFGKKRKMELSHRDFQWVFPDLQIYLGKISITIQLFWCCIWIRTSLSPSLCVFNGHLCETHPPDIYMERRRDRLMSGVFILLRKRNR